METEQKNPESTIVATSGVVKQNGFIYLYLAAAVVAVLVLVGVTVLSNKQTSSSIERSIPVDKFSTCLFEAQKYIKTEQLAIFRTGPVSAECVVIVEGSMFAKSMDEEYGHYKKFITDATFEAYNERKQSCMQDFSSLLSGDTYAAQMFEINENYLAKRRMCTETFPVGGANSDTSDEFGVN